MTLQLHPASQPLTHP